MNKRLLTFDDLFEFYSKYTRAKHFDCEEQGCEPIVVQTPATIKFKKSEIYEGLTAVRLQACHTDRNLNSSSISYDVMKNKMLPTFKNRPILGYIHEVNGQLEFYDHRMHIEDDELVYDEVAVGIVPESNEAELVYDKSEDRYNVMVSGYIFDEYTKATSILEREQELAVSVEISIKQMSYSPKDSCLNIEDGYFSGVTILGKNPDGSVVNPGMANSNIKLKDFNQSNNSMFTNITKQENSKLIETLEALNRTLSNFNINQDSRESVETFRKEEQVEMDETVKIEEEVTEVEEVKEMEEVVEETSEVENTTEVMEENEESTEEVTAPEVKEAEEVAEEETPEVGEETEIKEEESVEEVRFETIEKSFEIDGKKFAVSYELSHNDIAYGLSNLLGSYMDMDNEWYFVREVYDDRFVYQGYFTGKIYGQKYTKDDDVVAFDGERYALHEELLTDGELSQLNDMRSNYSFIQTELNSYKEAELCAQREAIFNDPAYAEFIETEGFKNIKENINTYSIDDLKTACELQFAKEVKAKGTFAFADKKEEPKKFMGYAFASTKEEKSSFLDSLLKK